MEMVRVLPRWPDTTTEVDIDGEALVTAVEATARGATARGATAAAAMAAEATEVAEAMVVEATGAVAMGAAPTPFGEAIEEGPEVAIEGVRGETTEDPGGSSKEGAGGAMGVATMGKEEAGVAIKLGYVGAHA